MIFLTAMDFTLPLADPVLKFLIILLIILGAPSVSYTHLTLPTIA